MSTWGQLTWGSNSWSSDQNNTSLSGISLSASLEGVTTEIGVEVVVTGIEITSSLTSLVAGTSALVTPNSPSPLATLSLNNVFGGELNTVQVTSPSNDEWGIDPWSQGQWGVGDGLTLFVGTESEHIADANVFPTSVSLTPSVGKTEIPVILNTGVGITSAIGNVFAGEVVEVQVTTAAATSWGDAPYGLGQWGQGVGLDISQGGEEIGLPSQEVPVTNTNLTLNVLANNQPFIIADANVAVTGQQITTTLGDEDAIPNTIVDLSGVSMTLTMDNVLAGISVLVLPTGVTSAISTGTIGLNAWEIVDSGTAPTWTEVDKAA